MEFEIWTDGACSPNPGVGGYGYVIKRQDVTLEGSAGYKHTTNNRMEMRAVLTPIQLLGERFERDDTSHPITIYSDSKYVTDAFNKGWIFNWMKKGWKKKKGEDIPNRDLWELLENAHQCLDLTFVWVKGHAGNELNERCDQLAVAAREQSELLEDDGYVKG